MLSVDFDGRPGPDPLQGEPLLRLVIVQGLRPGLLPDLADKIVIVLDKHILPFALLHPVDIPVVPDGPGQNSEPCLLRRLSDDGLHGALPRLDAAAGKLIVVVFQAVDQGRSVAGDDDTAGGGTDERRPDRIIVLGVDGKKKSHFLSTAWPPRGWRRPPSAGAGTPRPVRCGRRR